MSSGWLREEWHPPRDLATQRPWWPQLKQRWSLFSGQAQRQTEVELDWVQAAQRERRADDDCRLREHLLSMSRQFRFSSRPTASGDEWLQLRARLLGAWSEVARRELGMTPHATQIRAALEMHNGHLVQLAPGEGKTLAIGLTAGLYGATQRPCHVVTANDYLAARDAELMRGLLGWANLRVAAAMPELSPEELRQAYRADVVYATGKQLLADHLRDQLILGGEKDPTQRRIWEMQHGAEQNRPVGRGLWVAIVDEADSVLIDEATTPLIISSADDNPLLIEAVLGAKQLFDTLEIERDYVVKTEPVPDIRFTEAGKQRIDELSYLLPAFWRLPLRAQGVVSLSIMARYVYQRDRHYLIDEEGKIVIVDEKTGRVMAGRTWSHGIHQAIEAKEGVELSSPPKTVARMTFQTYFNCYHRLCGASGTLQGIGRELRETYGVSVVEIAPRLPSQLKDEPFQVFAQRDQRIEALVQETIRCHQRGQPVLIGTRKIKDTESIADALADMAVPHQILNAKHHAEEAEIVARAGQVGAVTVSTNMAGRGTDIGLGPGVLELGGLRVLVFEPHESTRIEWQLYGRAGRQGAPGSAQAYVYALDELMANALGPLYVNSVPVLLPVLTRPRAMRLVVRLSQAIVQWKAASQRKRLAERERSVANQLSFSE